MSEHKSWRQKLRDLIVREENTPEQNSKAYQRAEQAVRNMSEAASISCEKVVDTFISIANNPSPSVEDNPQ